MMNVDEHADPNRTPVASGDKPPEPRAVTSESLLQGQTEIRILHGEEVYRLLVTRNGKLILQK